MSLSFLDIVMEAKGKKKPVTRIDATEDDEVSDYNEDQSDDESDQDEEADTASDYTEDDESDDEESTSDENESEDQEETEDDTPTDYTEDDESDDEADTASDYTDDEESEDDIPDDDDDTPTDYTESEDELEGDESMDSDSEDTSSDSDEESTTEIKPEVVRKNNLLTDLIELRTIVDGFIDKNSGVGLDDSKKVSLINAVNKNLTDLSNQIHKYIVYRFNKDTYVNNQYFYNNSVEALNIIIKMVEKINTFKDNK